MKRFLRKIVSIGLTFAILFATTSFSADMHFCCNKLVDIAVFGKAKSCDDKVQKSESPSKECSVGAEDCCRNETFSKAGDDKRSSGYGGSERWCDQTMDDGVRRSWT